MDRVDPKVSVVVPIYNVEKYIERCVRSLFGQTFKDVEYIFVDDCTKDGSVAILERLLGEYPSISATIIRKEKNEGLPQARKTGVENAKGEYILHVDSDDWVEPDMVEALYNKAISDGADMVCCNWVEEYDDHTKEITLTPKPYNEHYESLLAFEMPAYVWCRLVRRSLYDQDFTFPTNNMWEDYVITCQLMKRCKQVSFIPRPLYHYLRSNGKSICNSEDVKNILRQEINNIFFIYQSILSERDLKVKSPTLGRMLFAMGWHAVRRNLFKNFSNAEKRMLVDGITHQLPQRNLGFTIFKQIALRLHMQCFLWLPHKE